jgi:hypothetical protein
VSGADDDNVVTGLHALRLRRATDAPNKAFAED